MKIDFSDQYIIKLAKVKVDDEFSHWEVEAGWTELQGFMEGTAPTSGGAIDMALEYLYDGPDSNVRWAEDDANSK